MPPSSMLRLPLTVAPVFQEWLEREQPGRAEKIESRIRAMRGGKLNNSQFGDRMRGSGAMADQIAGLFRLVARQHRAGSGLAAPRLHAISSPEAGDGAVVAVLILG